MAVSFFKKMYQDGNTDRDPKGVMRGTFLELSGYAKKSLTHLVEDEEIKLAVLA